MTRDEVVNRMARMLHSGTEDGAFQAACIAAQFAGLDPSLAEEESAQTELIASVFYSCLNADRFDLAAKIAWPAELFTTEPRFVKQVWDGFDSANAIMLMGSASSSKSYSMGVRLLLEWVRDPEYTAVVLVGPSEDHLRDNLFSHLADLHQKSAVKLPGITGDLFIGLDTKRRQGSIRGVVIPLGKKPAARIQGRKRRPRPKPHAKFGKMSRMFIFLDELEKIPPGVWKDIENVFSQVTKDVGNFKIAGAFNPEDPFGNCATRCEPVKGWDNFDPETDERWVSKRGWTVVRLDGAKGENIIAGREIYPGFQTLEGYNRIIQDSGGLDSPGYWTMCRACFPRTGAVFSVIPTGILSKMRGEFIFFEPPVKFGTVDIALEGGDVAEFSTGRFGRVVGWKKLDGTEIFFTDANNNRMIRYGVQQDQIFALKPGDTVAIGTQIKENCGHLGIDPGWVLIDRTGNGAGVHDWLKSVWSQEVRGVNYSEKPTAKKILAEDTKTAEEEYDKITSEVWFALKKFSEYDLFKTCVEETIWEALNKELGGRRYATGKLRKVESKVEYKSRNNPSPNKADATTLTVHLCRIASGLVLSGILFANTDSMGLRRAPVCRVDASNTFEDLETAQIHD